MKVNEWFKKRICFHQEFGKEAYPFKLPVFDPELKKIDNAQTNEAIFTQDEFLDWLYEINDYYRPDMPSFEFIKVLLTPKNSEICFTAFVDSVMGEFIEMESACKEYKILPHPGGLLDQLNIYLDAFSIIRSEKIRYENKRNKDMMDKMKSSSSDSSKSKRGLHAHH